MDRDTAIAYLVEHYKNPRHAGQLDDADVQMSGGNPGCGDVVTIFLKADGERIEKASFVGSGCTISQAAASILLERTNRDRPALRQVLDFSYEEMMDLLGRDIVGFRQRCATVALAALKAAVRTLEMDRKLRAAGHSDEDIRRLRRGLAARMTGDGLVVDPDAERAAMEGAGEAE